MTNLLPNYGRLPFALVKGENTTLTDDVGNDYLDFTSGIGVMNMGYSFEDGKNAVKAQLDVLSHMSNLYQNPLQEEVAEKLSYGGTYKAFFCNSGTEANEAAIKLVRLIKPGKKILAMNNGFHGRTFGAMSATMQEKIQAGFAPLVPDFTSCDYNDVTSLDKAVKTGNIAAIMVECIQGEGGVLPMTQEFADALKTYQSQGILLVVDEVQTGIGRTGTLFAFEQFGLQPDIFTAAKALGNGIPTGAMLTLDKYAEIFSAGKHGSTFGGNPLAMAQANAVLSNLTEEFLTEVRQKSNIFLTELSKSLSNKASVKKIQGIGLMIGIVLADETKLSEDLSKLREQGLLALSAGHDVIRLLPPLVMSEQQLSAGIKILEEVL
ncbi:acetylornithine transaminase [Lactococcus nasutitermitis]|uniref:Acetylornithine transaminase n=1 Tax=Lactococcus nasutitermitis TaxID=1652957 RepID=A0ABV9JEC2_9LACT|nr:acetylornithine transaminase [Lactococcus nasutitermitis]